LIAKKLTGAATEEDLEQLQALMKKYPDTTHPLELLSDLWKPAEPGDPSEDKVPIAHRNSKEAEKAFGRHLVRMEQMRERTMH
jgi:hypothetical protein